MERLGTSFLNLIPCHLAAAVTAVVVGSSAQADIVFSDDWWHVPQTARGLYMNFETPEASTSTSIPSGWDLHAYGPTTERIFWEKPSSPPYRFGCVQGPRADRTIEVLSLPIGTLVGPKLVDPKWSFGTSSSSASQEGWQVEADNYIGFRFADSKGELHYGWALMAIGETMGDRTIDEIGWESTPDTAITVGDRGAYSPCRDSNPVLIPGSNAVEMDLKAPSLETSCGSTIYKANYFQFVAPFDADYTFGTCYSKTPTKMAVLSACSDGKTLDCNNDRCEGSSSAKITVPLTADSIVYVVIGAADEATGLPEIMPVDVHLSQVRACTQAIAIEYGRDEPFNTAKGGRDAQLAQRSSDGLDFATIHQPVWFSFSPAVSGDYGFQTCDSDGDTLLAIGEQCPEVGGSFRTIAFNDDAPCSSGETSSTRSYIDAINNGATGPGAGFPLSRDLVAGRTYYLCVGAFDPKRPVSGSLRVIAPTASTCPADLNRDGVVNGFDLSQMLASWGPCQ